MEYSETDVSGGGGEGGLPRTFCQVTGQICNPKPAFLSSVYEVSEHPAKSHLKVTDDVTDQIKGQSFAYLSALALLDEVASRLRTSGVTRTKKVKLRDLGTAIHVFEAIFRRKRENRP